MMFREGLLGLGLELKQKHSSTTLPFAFSEREGAKLCPFPRREGLRPSFAPLSSLSGVELCSFLQEQSRALSFSAALYPLPLA